MLLTITEIKVAINQLTILQYNVPLSIIGIKKELI